MALRNLVQASNFSFPYRSPLFSFSLYSFVPLCYGAAQKGQRPTNSTAIVTKHNYMFVHQLRTWMRTISRLNILLPSTPFSFFLSVSLYRPNSSFFLPPSLFLSVLMCMQARVYSQCLLPLNVKTSSRAVIFTA